MTAFSLLNLTSCNVTIAAQCVNGDVRLIEQTESVEWFNCVLMEYGELLAGVVVLSGFIGGTHMQPTWCVGNWDTVAKVRISY